MRKIIDDNIIPYGQIDGWSYNVSAKIWGRFSQPDTIHQPWEGEDNATINISVNGGPIIHNCGNRPWDNINPLLREP